MLIVALTMVAFFSWQLSSDPGLGGMYLDALCEDGKARECAIDLVGERVAIRGLSASKCVNVTLRNIASGDFESSLFPRCL